MSNRIYVLTVTYGKRWHLLEQTIQAALSQAVARVIVVDNGAKEDIASLASARFGDKVHVITVGYNSGSAGGFDKALRFVAETDAEYVLLLDDDNKLLPGAVHNLMHSYEAEARPADADKLALLAYRPVRLLDISLGVPVEKLNPRAGSFFGFHVLDIPFKLWRRIPFVKKLMKSKSETPSKVLMQTASWSGLFFNKKLLDSVGFPNTQFLLYADDTEFSMRIVRGGGRIVLCTAAQVEDIDMSWNLKSMYSNTFDGLLLGSGDFRAYYSTRNQTYLEIHVKDQVFIWSRLNRCCHVSILALRALMLNKWKRFSLLMTAMRDGKEAKLGMSERFPI